MPLGQPKPGLHKIHNGTKQAVKTSVVIAPGDTLAVSEDLATQLTGLSTAFKPGDAPDMSFIDPPEVVEEPKDAPKKATRARKAKKAN